MHTKQHHLKTDLVCLAFILVAWVLLIEAATAADSRSDAAKRRTIDAMYAQYKNALAGIDDISASEALSLTQTRPAVFIDVREPQEQHVSILPRAIIEREFIKDYDRYKDHVIIAYCTIGHRSGIFAAKFKQKGVRILNLRGGMLAWLHAGGRVYKDGSLVDKVHVYDRQWDLAPSGYESVY